jgi:hypothetical protein
MKNSLERRKEGKKKGKTVFTFDLDKCVYVRLEVYTAMKILQSSEM